MIGGGVPVLPSCEAEAAPREVKLVPNGGPVRETLHEPARSGHQPSHGKSCERVAVPVLHTGCEVLPWLRRLLLEVLPGLCHNSATTQCT